MSWFKNLFGLGSEEPAVVAKKQEAPAERTVVPIDLAKRFAKGVPGARVEEFDGTERDDGLLARVTFVHEGVEARIVLKSYGDGDLVAWLQTRCIGTYGFFALVHSESTARAADDTEARFYFDKKCHVSGPRLRNEVARIRSLPEDVQTRLLKLAKKVDLVKLDEEVLAVVIGSVFEFMRRMDDRENGTRFVLSLTSELTFLAKQFPPLAEDVADLAEARTCSFCKASFIFAPHAPSCTACGAPATAASIMPPSPIGVVPDDPLDEFDPDDPDWQSDKDDLMSDLRELATALVAIVDTPVVREEPERNRIFVEYTLDGRPFRAKIMDDHVGIRTNVPGAKGDFFLLYTDHDVQGERDPTATWHESERRIFFSKYCRIQSGHGKKEAARLASLPAAERTRLTELAETFHADASLEDEHFAIGLGSTLHEHGVEGVLPASRELAKIADALPRDFDPDDPVHFRLSACSHCHWAYFVDVARPGCLHCGAPAT